MSEKYYLTSISSVIADLLHTEVIFSFIKVKFNSISFSTNQYSNTLIGTSYNKVRISLITESQLVSLINVSFDIHTKFYGSVGKSCATSIE